MRCLSVNLVSCHSRSTRWMHLGVTQNILSISEWMPPYSLLGNSVVPQCFPWLLLMWYPPLLHRTGGNQLFDVLYFYILWILLATHFWVLVLGLLHHSFFVGLHVVHIEVSWSRNIHIYSVVLECILELPLLRCSIFSSNWGVYQIIAPLTSQYQ